MENLAQVVISGSLNKHPTEIEDIRKKMQAHGICILAPEPINIISNENQFARLATDNPHHDDLGIELDFLRNIMNANFIYVANIGGYVGRSVSAEMGFAIILGIPIVIASPNITFSHEVPEKVQKILQPHPYHVCSPGKIDFLRVNEMMRFANVKYETINQNERATLIGHLNDLLNFLKSNKKPT